MEEEAKGVSGKQERAHPENTVSVALSVMYLLRFSGLKCVFIKIGKEFFLILVRPKVVVEWLKLLFLIREGPASNPCPVTAYTNSIIMVFLSFSK
jgi:hypothetical protein